MVYAHFNLSTYYLDLDISWPAYLLISSSLLYLSLTLNPSYSTAYKKMSLLFPGPVS